MSPSPTRRAGITRLAAVPRPTSGCGHGEHIPRQVSQIPSRDGGNRTAESTEQKVEKTKRDLADVVEEAAAGMRRLMAATSGAGTGGAQAQDAQQAVSRLFEGVMATNTRFADGRGLRCAGGRPPAAR